MQLRLVWSELTRNTCRNVRLMWKGFLIVSCTRRHTIYLLYLSKQRNEITQIEERKCVPRRKITSIFHLCRPRRRCRHHRRCLSRQWKSGAKISLHKSAKWWVWKTTKRRFTGGHDTMKWIKSPTTKTCAIIIYATVNFYSCLSLTHSVWISSHSRSIIFTIVNAHHAMVTKLVVVVAEMCETFCVRKKRAIAQKGRISFQIKYEKWENIFRTILLSSLHCLSFI